MDERDMTEAGAVADPETASKASMRRFFVEECGQPEMAAQILDAAMRLFARKGYAATSVREIVNEAQVTNPMLYYYFQSKEGVFVSLVDSLVGSFDGQIERLLEEQMPLRDKLLRIVELHMNAAREVPVVLRFMFSTLFSPRDSVPLLDMPQRRMCLMHKVAQMFDDAVAAGEFEMSAGFDTTYLAHTFMGMIAQQMIFALKLSEHAGDNPAHVSMLKMCMSEKNTRDLVSFFFAGAGKVKET